MKMNPSLSTLVLVGASIFLNACEKRERAQIPQRCVDNQGRVVDDWYCEQDARRPGYGHPGFPYFYHWYWGGPSSYAAPGTIVRGGTYTAPASSEVEVFSPGPTGPQRTAVATSPGTAAARGLFGSSAAAHGEGGGGAGE